MMKSCILNMQYTDHIKIYSYSSLILTKIKIKWKFYPIIRTESVFLLPAGEIKRGVKTLLFEIKEPN